MIYTVIKSLLLICVLIALIWDVVSCYLYIAEQRGGRGPSGIPILSLIIYWMCYNAQYILDCVWKRTPAFTGRHLVGLIIIHIVLQFLIPFLHCWYYGRRGIGSSGSDRR